VPSYLLSPGDTIQLKEKSRKLEIVHESLKRTRGDSGVPTWLSLNKAELSGTILSVPERVDVPLNANEQLIVELYSK
jgi:small subunit ribosomal protein S4